MKIGILTFHRAHNYGAMLQAYALHKVLSDKGHNVEFCKRIRDASIYTSKKYRSSFYS